MLALQMCYKNRGDEKIFVAFSFFRAFSLLFVSQFLRYYLKYSSR